MVDFVKTICASVKSCVFLAMVIQPLIGNPYNGYINSYYWVDDHPLLYGNNGSLDPIAHLRGAQLVLPSAFQCDRSRIPQRSGQMWHEKKTAASAYLFHLQSAWMVVVFFARLKSDGWFWNQAKTFRWYKQLSSRASLAFLASSLTRQLGAWLYLAMSLQSGRRPE